MKPLPQEWILPFYLNILHGNYAGNYLNDEQRKAFDLAVINALKTVSIEQLSQLIGSHWREAITGSWLAGIGGFVECRTQIGIRLLESNAVYAGQSHAFAMACFADDTSAEYLELYLDKFLRLNDCYYDQGWAMPALMWIDEVCNTNRSERFLSKGGLWDTFTSDKIATTDAWTIESCRKHFWLLMSYCRTHFLRR